MILMLKKLPQHKNVQFIDPETGQVKCTFNECYSKFEEIEYEKIKTPSKMAYYPHRFKIHCHKCSECGMKYSSPSDTKKSKKSQALQKPVKWLSSKEYNDLKKTYNKISSFTKDPTKIIKIQKRLCEIDKLPIK